MPFLIIILLILFLPIIAWPLLFLYKLARKVVR
nr:MAG TPA: ATPase [Caudoviricetes sp.]